MPRNSKNRKVCQEPINRLFTSETNEGEPVVLSIEEVEAMRLCDFAGLSQEDAACNMGVSRGTFQRILYAARKKSSFALSFGRSIVIEGGNYSVCGCRNNCPKHYHPCILNKGEAYQHE